MTEQIAEHDANYVFFHVRKPRRLVTDLLRGAPLSRTSTRTVSALCRFEERESFLGRETLGIYYFD